MRPITSRQLAYKRGVSAHWKERARVADGLDMFLNRGAKEAEERALDAVLRWIAQGCTEPTEETDGYPEPDRNPAPTDG